jgi:hypothetical protein
MAKRDGAKHPGNTKNLQPPWPKGVSGNPAGRPRLHDAVAQAIRDGDKGRLAKGINVVYDRAARGDLASLEWLVSHGWGKPPLEIGGEDGGPVEIVIRHVRVGASGAAPRSAKGKG